MFFFYLDREDEKPIEQKKIGIFNLFYSIIFVRLEKYLEREEEKTMEKPKMGKGIFNILKTLFPKN